MNIQLEPGRTANERYNTDPHFRLLVDVLYNQIAEAKYTPSELREAVILAAIRFERRNPMPRTWMPSEEDAIRRDVLRRE